MTRACCPGCQIRFTSGAATFLAACPDCGEPLQPSDELQQVVGFRRFRLEDIPPPLAEAIAASIPIPDPETGWSGPTLLVPEA